MLLKVPLLVGENAAVCVRVAQVETPVHEVMSFITFSLHCAHLLHQKLILWINNGTFAKMAVFNEVKTNTFFKSVSTKVKYDLNDNVSAIYQLCHNLHHANKWKVLI